ncbi:MAG TPA: metallophosphoesterase [Geminicoccaceae bacterium]|nr:metallophosphoesterase [Geminicoccaceae bacterium]
MRSLADFAGFADRSGVRRLADPMLEAKVLRSALLDVRADSGSVLPEQAAGRARRTLWPQPDLRHRADWRLQRARIEQTRVLHTPWGERPMPPFSPLKRGCELVRDGLTAAGLLPGLARFSLEMRRNEIDLAFAGLPAAFEGYRILHISDPHFDAIDGIADAIRARIAGLSADLCVFTGDYRAAETGGFTQRSILAPMAKIVEEVGAADGSLAVLGNHDTHEMVEPLEDLGVRVLTNEQVEVGRGGEAIALLGFDDPYRFYTASSRRFAEALAERGGPAADAGPPAPFRIMLVHTPDLAEAAARLGCALYLCGHTHGGQICLPGGRPIVQHLHKERGLGRGLWRRRQMIGYTSLGAGVAGSLPLRLFAPPEITLFRLRRARA